MPAWKQALHRAVLNNGHRLVPIVRTSTKHKGTRLAEQPNSYDTGCYHCSLRIEVRTTPGTPVLLKYRVDGKVLPEGTVPPRCSLVRIAHRAAHEQRQAMIEATLQQQLLDKDSSSGS